MNSEEYKIQQIFQFWNKYKGRGYGKVKWRSHKILSIPCRNAIKKRFRERYDVETLQEAIKNYARVLTNRDCKWSHAWKLVEFLVRRHPHRRDEEQLTRWLPGEFELDDYLSNEAKVIRARVAEPKPEPFTPLTLEQKQKIRAKLRSK